MKDNGVEDKPIWDTELGWAEPKPFPSDEMAAAYVARSFILSWAAGIQTRLLVRLGQSQVR